MKDFKCPVCETELSEGWNHCRQCGFEIHIYPENAPKGVIDFEELRVRDAKRRYELVTAKLKQKEEEIEGLIQQKKQLEEENDALAEQKKQLEIEKTALAEQKKQLEIEKVEQSEPINTSQEQLATTHQVPPAYLVLLNGDEIQYVYSLDEGDNSFGIAKSEVGHRQVIVGDLVPRHFSIKVRIIENNGKRKPTFTVTPLEGGITIDNPLAAPITSGELTIDINQDIFAGGIRFHLLGNKDYH